MGEIFTSPVYITPTIAMILHPGAMGNVGLSRHSLYLCPVTRQIFLIFYLRPSDGQGAVTPLIGFALWPTISVNVVLNLGHTGRNRVG